MIRSPEIAAGFPSILSRLKSLCVTPVDSWISGRARGWLKPPACERRCLIGFYLRGRREKRDVYGSRRYPGLWRSRSVDV